MRPRYSLPLPLRTIQCNLSDRPSPPRPKMIGLLRFLAMFFSVVGATPPMDS